MQIKEMVWTDFNSQYSLKELPDGSVELSVDGKVVNFHERQAVENLIDAWARFDPPSECSAEGEPNPVVFDEPPAPVSTDFPKKIRNAILIMVAVGVTILIIDALRQVT
jgi:hypothetical protein